MNKFDYFRECFLCDFRNGILIWKSRPASHFHKQSRGNGQKSFNKKFSGRVAGRIMRSTNTNYRVVGVGGDSYLAHRIIWLLKFGSWPKNDIDHIDGDGLNNRLENLRDVSRSENLKNTKIHNHNTSGIMGVGYRKDKGKWRAYIKVKGKSIHLGYFDEFEDAVESRRRAEINNNFHKNHGRRLCQML